MEINERIRKAAKNGVKLKHLSDIAEVSYYKISSVVNPDKYRGESKFDRFEEERISKALDQISEALKK